MASSVFSPRASTLRIPFDPDADIPPQGWLAQLLQRPDARAAVAVVERALARRAPNVPSAATVAGIFAHHRVSMRLARELTIPLWLRMLHSCLDDDVLTDEEIRYLTALRIALNLRESDVDAIWNAERSILYRDALEEALADDRLTDDEWRQLDAIANGLRLSPARRAEISAWPLAEVVHRAVEGALDDGRLTPAERAQLDELTLRLGLGRDAVTDADRHALDRAALLWRIENEELPEIQAPINLQRGEICHCVFNAAWYELRTRTVRTYRTGPVASLHIMKGLSYRVGSYQTHRVTTNELTLIDEGTAYVTNKRLIFDGAKRNSAIRYSGILSLTPYKDGVEIEKATGKTPTLVIRGDAEIVTAILAEALARA